MKLRIPFQHDSNNIGHNFGDITSNGFIHPGVDLNAGDHAMADLGMPFYPMADGIVEYSKDTGEGMGNLIIIHHPDLARWSGYAHAQERLVEIGQEVSSQFPIGKIGDTGGNWTSHLHFTIYKKRLSSWTKYTKGMTLEQVNETYENPLEYIEKMNNSSISENPFVKDSIRPTISAMWEALETLKKDNQESWGTINTAQQYLNKCNNTLRNN